jgi:hypothetical protein
MTCKRCAELGEASSSDPKIFCRCGSQRASNEAQAVNLAVSSNLVVQEVKRDRVGSIHERVSDVN